MNGIICGDGIARNVIDLWQTVTLFLTITSVLSIGVNDVIIKNSPVENKVFLGDEKQEALVCFFLDTKNQVLEQKKIFKYRELFYIQSSFKTLQE